MNELELRTLVVNTAKSYLNYNEYDGSHKKIIDIYNAHKPLARGYKVRYTDAWCATFISTIAIKCGLTDIMPTECGCGQMVQLYYKIGRWKENDSYVPKIADIVMYDWDDSGKGDNTGWPDHVGFVTDVNGSKLTILEGNINNAVGYRTLTINARTIRGYCIPDYASKASGKSNSDNKTPVVKEETHTETKVPEVKPTSAYTLTQFIKDVQSATGSKVDGIAGSETIGNTITVSAVLNRKHIVVRAIQRRLDALGYKQVGEIDGIAGSKFTAAVKAFQKDNGCVVDGEITARAKTWKKLLKMA